MFGEGERGGVGSRVEAELVVDPWSEAGPSSLGRVEDGDDGPIVLLRIADGPIKKITNKKRFPRRSGLGQPCDADADLAKGKIVMKCERGACGTANRLHFMPLRCRLASAAISPRSTLFVWSTAAGVKQDAIASLQTAQLRCKASSRRASSDTASLSETLVRRESIYLALGSEQATTELRPTRSTRCTPHRKATGWHRLPGRIWQCLNNRRLLFRPEQAPCLYSTHSC